MESRLPEYRSPDELNAESLKIEVLDSDNEPNRVIDSKSDFTLTLRLILKPHSIILKNGFSINKFHVAFYLETIGTETITNYYSVDEPWVQGKSDYYFSTKVQGGEYADGAYKVVALISTYDRDNRLTQIAGFVEGPLIQFYSLD